MEKQPNGQRITTILIIILALGVLIFLILKPKVKKEAPPPKPAAVVEPNAAKAPPADPVVVVVNGREIKESQIQGEINMQLERQAQQLPPEVIGQYQQRLRAPTIERMISERLLDSEVEKAGVKITDSDVDNYFNEMGAQQKPPVTVADIRRMAESSGQNFDDIKARIRRGLGYQKVIEAAGGKVDVNDSDIKAYYDENKVQFETPEQVKASHILIKTDPNIIDPNQAKAGAVARAQDILKQINAGADFAELAKANSACPSAARGGDLGYFERGQMIKAFEDVAFELMPGQISDVVETKFGYHIIKVTGHKDPNTVPLEQVKDGIKNMLTAQEQGLMARKYIQTLRSKADVKYPQEAEPNMPEPPALVEPEEEKAAAGVNAPPEPNK